MPNESSALRKQRKTTSGFDSSQLVIPQIIGGIEAQRFRYSYVLTLQTAGGTTICGGTLIAPDIVLSAAHCTGMFEQVVIGQHDVRDDHYDVYGVEAVMQHPWYSFTDENMDINYDFLLVKLNETVSGYRPVELNRNAEVPSSLGDSLTVLGWGTTDLEGTEMSEYLQKVDLEYIPNDVCESSGTWIDGEYYSFHGFIEKNMLCAWGDQKDACLGDSGGPIIIEGNDAVADVQVGVVSFGVGCANPDFPAIYARVSDQLWWIDAVVCGLSAEPPSDFLCEAVPDSDQDGVPDVIDLCPNDVASGPRSAQHGCPDEDEDGIPDKDDLCSGTQMGLIVGLDGCGTESPTSAPTVSLSPTSDPSFHQEAQTSILQDILLMPYAMICVGVGAALFVVAIGSLLCLRRRSAQKKEISLRDEDLPRKKEEVIGSRRGVRTQSSGRGVRTPSSGRGDNTRSSERGGDTYTTAFWDLLGLN